MPGKFPLYIVRHGCTKLNGESGTSVDKIRAWTDVPLTEKGRQEAMQAASKLAGKGIGAIVSSDLVRAEETAQIIGRQLGIKPTFTEKLRPWQLGIFTGKPTMESLPRIEIYVRDTPDKDVPKGESFNTFRKRAFEGFYEAVKDHPGKLVCCVTHHRDEMLILGWDKDGQPLNHAIDPDELLQKGDPPGGIHKIQTTLQALKGLLTHKQVGFREATGWDSCGTCKAYMGKNKCKKVEPPMDADDTCLVGVSKLSGRRYSPEGARIEAEG